MIEGEYSATRSGDGIWMSDAKQWCSVSRMIAIDVMMAMGLDPNDFRTRDKIINGINDRVNGTLDSISQIR